MRHRNKDSKSYMTVRWYFLRLLTEADILERELDLRPQNLSTMLNSQMPAFAKMSVGCTVSQDRSQVFVTIPSSHHKYGWLIKDEPEELFFKRNTL